MLDLDLDQRLADDLRAVVDDEVPSERLDDLVRQRIHRRARQRRARAAAGVVVAVALVAGLAIRFDDSPSTSVVASEGDHGEHGEGDTPSEGSSTTSMTETSTTSAPVAPAEEVPSTPVPSGPASAATLQVTGTYDGTEHYVLTERESCAIVSTLDLTFTLTDGSTWQFHADYCGDLQGEQGEIWSSPGGTFDFTLPDGSTLTGDMPEQETPSDTDGVPYQITVTGGTGRHTGATGTCDLDNHLTDLALGIQQQTGSFSCDLTTGW